MARGTERRGQIKRNKDVRSAARKVEKKTRRFIEALLTATRVKLVINNEEARRGKKKRGSLSSTNGGCLPKSIDETL